MDDRRSDPDKLLEQIQKEESSAHKGRLKIYLGAAPGVGKTYGMLKDAIESKQKGKDVVIGIIESHGRAEIEGMLNAIEKLPLQTVQYRGKSLQEFSLDHAIQRNPELILIDEMAHTNAPGLRHTKRWQDIRELLDNRIDVWTTLNVQHIESLHDDVARIIHAPVHETVPDFMLDIADSIELIDLPSEELLKRLHEGKIYLPERIEVAARHFFLPGNLIALRELALRTTARYVGKQVQTYRQGKGIRHVWSSHERIMVCVGPEIESLQLIRNGKQLATSFQCDWMAVHINSLDHPETESEKSNTIQYLRLAEQLGAETCQLDGPDIVNTLMQFAREQNITLIMVWKPVRSRWQELFTRQIANELVRASGEIDVYIMTGLPTETPSLSALAKRRPKNTLKTWIFAALWVPVITLISTRLTSAVHPGIGIVLFLLLVLLVTRYTQSVPIFIATVISMLIYVHKYFSSSLQLSTGFFSLAVSITLGWMILQLTKQAKTAQFSAWRANTLQKLVRRLTTAVDTAQIISISKQSLSDLFDCQVTFYMAGSTGPSGRVAEAADTENQIDEDALMWVLRMGQMAGLGTDTLPMKDSLYLPLLTRSGTIGVVCIRPLKQGQQFLPEQLHLLEACVSQISLTIELNQLRQEASSAALSTQLEHAKVEFMHSVARELHSPVSSIAAYSKILETLASRNEPDKITRTAELIQHESNQISHLVSNLLQIARLDEGVLQPVREAVTLKKLVEDLINERYLNQPIFDLDIPLNLTTVSIDNTLIREVFLNLMDNAVRNSPHHESVKITARKTEGMVEICVLNKGPKIPEQEIEKIFEKYYKVSSDTHQGGLGLGLAICRKIIEAHGGKIWAENREEKGTAFCFTLPVEKKHH